MAEKLTPQQKEAVENRGGKLLVSAAAGSGKTKVLVDRLLSYLMDPKDPANIDQFLIITYTKAAASELRGKIAAKLMERMTEEPENRHLQKQMQRLYLTKISTVHAFCGDILREYAYQVDLAPDFRVADENECAELRNQLVQKVLEKAYEAEQPDADFIAFADTQGLGRDDRLLPQIILQLYDSARCHLDPEGWLNACVESAQVERLTDAAQTPWGAYLLSELRDYLALQIGALTQCAQEAALAEGMEKPAALLLDTVSQLQRLQNCDSWDAVCKRKDIDYGRLTISKKCPDQELGERIKAVRDACKKGLEKKLKPFADSSEQMLQDMRQCAPAVRGMTGLVRAFSDAYEKAKRARRILDFGDLEHRTLDLLLGKSRSGPTAAAREIGERFREIMVDEYQDSNAVQDAIFSVLTQKRNNCFMVGDVKQSIYQFRLADPTIFLEKYNTYTPAEQAVPGQGRKVLLSANFRSGGAVLAGVNDVFHQCMSPEVGGLYYGEEEALREGVPHEPLGEPEVELLVVDVQEHTYEEEPTLVAKRIEELLDGTHLIRDKGKLRPVNPGDIAVLLRSPGSVGRYFHSALEARGIRCASSGGEDLLQTEEISTLHALLQTVYNPRQDIPLIAVLASPLFGFTADDLAALRSGNRHICVYESLLKWENTKAERFLTVLEQLRWASKMQTLAQLLDTVLVLTGMDSLYAAMPNGEARSRNLQIFYSMAVDFEATSRRDLGQFLDFLETMAEKGIVSAGGQSATDAVTLMSIHKSKGLEFPVVFVCGLSREFNRESTRGQVLCHKELGLGLTAVDEKNRVRYPTIAKRAIAAKIAAESLSEEMRVLYVALTRAKDRLIMTYADQNLATHIKQMALRMDMGDNRLLTADAVCPGHWVLMAALRRTEAGALFALGGKPRVTEPGYPPWRIQVETVSTVVSGGIGSESEKRIPAAAAELLRQGLSFRYPYIAATAAPSKQTATQRKGRDKDAEAAEHTPLPKVMTHRWRKPSFVEKTEQRTDFGNAMHNCMQYIRYEVCTDEAAVIREVQRMVAESLLSPEMGQRVDCRRIAAFFQSELGQKLRSGDYVLREFKFSILDDGANFNPVLQGEKILLQGVVDCALIEEDGITVIDFKTDFVTADTLYAKVEHYRPQVVAYASALERIYKKPVKAALLYFFRLDKFVTVQ